MRAHIFTDDTDTVGVRWLPELERISIYAEQPGIDGGRGSLHLTREEAECIAADIVVVLMASERPFCSEGDERNAKEVA